MSKKNEEENRQQNSVDKVNNLINKGKSTYKWSKRAYKTARTIRSAAIAAEAAADAGGALASSPVWGPVAVIGFILLVVFIVMISVITGSGGGGNTTATCTSTCEIGSCTSPLIQDTTSTCPYAYINRVPEKQVCCVPQRTCKDIGGSCISADICPSGSTQDVSGATCSDSATPTCCVPKGSQPPIHFYCQYTRAYTTNTCNIIYSGCDPTSLAMIAASFGLLYTPLSMATNNGNMGCSRATSLDQTKSAISNTFPSNQYSVVTGLVSGAGILNTKLVAQLTSSGYYIVAIGCMTFNSSIPPAAGGHSVVIGGVNSNGTLRTYDPTYCTNDSNYWIRSLNPNPGGGDILSGSVCNTSGFNNWLYAAAIKKI